MIWTVSGLIWSERRNFKNFSDLEAIGHLQDRYEVERRNIDFFTVQLNKQLFAGQICNERRKIKKFLNLVIKSPVAVPIWSRKENFSLKLEAKCHFLSLYGVKEEKSEIFSSIRLANSLFHSLYGMGRRKSSDFCQNAPFHLY